MTGIFDPETNTWKPSADADWRFSNIHERNRDCQEYGCMIHNPSDSRANVDDWPYSPRADGRMERSCPHSIGHPDRDVANFLVRIGVSHRAAWTHGCDGCCG